MDVQDEYRFVDTAIGGLDKRNHVKPVEEFVPDSTTDCFTSAFRFSASFREWRNTHHNEKGKPTVAGYPGPAYALFLPIDIDNQDDPEQALEQLRQVLHILANKYGVSLDEIRVYYSGYKGFHIEVPARYFGGFEPSPEIHEQLKCLVQALFPNWQELGIDLAIYKKTQLWRCPNTRHAVTGRYKIALTAQEVFDLDLESIKALASAPREALNSQDHQPEAIPELVNLWQEVRQVPTVGQKAPVEDDWAQFRKTRRTPGRGTPP